MTPLTFKVSVALALEAAFPSQKLVYSSHDEFSLAKPGNSWFCTNVGSAIRQGHGTANRVVFEEFLPKSVSSSNSNKLYWPPSCHAPKALLLGGV